LGLYATSGSSCRTNCTRCFGRHGSNIRISISISSSISSSTHTAVGHLGRFERVTMMGMAARGSTPHVSICNKARINSEVWQLRAAFRVPRRAFRGGSGSGRRRTQGRALAHTTRHDYDDEWHRVWTGAAGARIPGFHGVRRRPGHGSEPAVRN
jgi:hypothetical protein